MAAAADAAGFAQYAIVIEPLEGPRVRVCVVAGGGAELYPASMIKTPLAVAVACAERAGRLCWDEQVTVDAANLTPNDAPSPLEAGAVSTVAELVTLMLARSDNVATNLLIDRADREAATSDLRRLGFERTAVRRKLSGALPLIADPAATGRNTHPAAEAAALFARLAAGDLPGAERIRAALRAQYWNAKLSMGLAPGDQFEHKTGDTDEVSHDGGILQLAGGRSYAIAVYTGSPSSDETDARFATLMRELRPLL